MKYLIGIFIITTIYFSWRITKEQPTYIGIKSDSLYLGVSLSELEGRGLRYDKNQEISTNEIHSSWSMQDWVIGDKIHFVAVGHNFTQPTFMDAEKRLIGCHITYTFDWDYEPNKEEALAYFETTFGDKLFLKNGRLEYSKSSFVHVTYIVE